MTELIALFAVIISLYAAYINEEKLRLDLYNKRFDIYKRTIDMYDQAGHFDASDLDASFDAFYIKYHDFKKAYMESKLLFDEKDKIYEMLREMEIRCYRIIAYKKALNGQTTQALIQGLAEDIKWMEDNIHKILDHMAPYLNFRCISPWGRIRQRVCSWFCTGQEEKPDN